MKKFIAFVAAMLMLTGMDNAFGQAPPPVVFSGNYTQPTYSAVATGLTPAASATDWFTITGSATKVVNILEVQCTGISTAAASQPVIGTRRSTANSGGTATTITAAKHASASGDPTAVVRSYTANPTLGTAAGAVRSDRVATNTATSAAFGQDRMIWRFGPDSPMQTVVLNGATEVFSLNGNAASYVAGTAFSCSVTWTEL